MSYPEKVEDIEADFKIKSLDIKGPRGFELIDNLRVKLNAPFEPTVFPPHFLKASFSKIGGEIYMIESSGKDLGALFLFPRNGDDEPFTARLQITKEGQGILNKAYIYQTLEWAGLDYKLYDPNLSPYYQETHMNYGDLDIGRPSEKEAQEIRILQKQIWGSEDDFLYPYDIHSSNFNLATSLVVRDKKEKVVGFLFGFYSRSSNQLPEIITGKYRSDLMVESQLMGFLPEYRGRGLGFELKRQQGLKAISEKIDMVTWTVDPLQFSNAVLNFSKLGAIACDFYPDYYHFTNELNQVPASRFNVTWLLASPRVMGILSLKEKKTSKLLNPEELRGLEYINEGIDRIDLDVNEAEWLAIEVPPNWTDLQNTNIAVAYKWRETTDKLFKHYLGPKGKGYAITDVGANLNKKYLLARKMEMIPGI